MGDNKIYIKSGNAALKNKKKNPYLINCSHDLCNLPSRCSSLVSEDFDQFGCVVVQLCHKCGR